MVETGASSSLGSASASQAPAAAPDIGAPAASTLSHARNLIDQINKHHDLQSQFITPDKVDPKSLENAQKFAEAVGKFLEPIGKFFYALSLLFQPLASVMPYILIGLAIAALLALLSPVVRMSITTRFQRLLARDHLKAETPWRPTKAAVVALLHDIDALAAAGQYDEAVHLLLVRSVADINAFRPDLVKLHFSARDICLHPLLPEGARPAFRQIVQWVEKSYFAGIAVGRDGFTACRRSYVDFVAAEGIA